MSRFDPHPDGKQLYVWRSDSYGQDSDVEKFLGQHAVGWKIHLPVPADRNHPLTRDIARFLNGHPYVYQYKIGKGGEEEEGKRLTIYIGGWERTAAFAHTLHEQFGKKLAPAKAWTNIRLIGEISARFDAESFPGGAYAKYGGARGLSGLKNFSYDMWNRAEALPVEHRLAIGRRTMNEITKDFGDYCLGRAVTEKYLRLGIAGLPLWAQHWCHNGQVPFELETAAINAKEVLFSNPVPSGLAESLNIDEFPQIPPFSRSVKAPQFTKT